MKNKFLIFLGIIIVILLIIIIVNQNNTRTINIPVTPINNDDNTQQVPVPKQVTSKYPQFIETYIKTQTTGTIYSYNYNGQVYYSIQRSLAPGEGTALYDIQGNIVGACNASLGPNGVHGMCDQLSNSQHTLIWKGKP